VESCCALPGPTGITCRDCTGSKGEQAGGGESACAWHRSGSHHHGAPLCRRSSVRAEFENFTHTPRPFLPHLVLEAQCTPNANPTPEFRAKRRCSRAADLKQSTTRSPRHPARVRGRKNRRRCMDLSLLTSGFYLHLKRRVAGVTVRRLSSSR